MLLHTREPSLVPVDRGRHDRDRPHQPARLAPDRLPGPAQQGDRRAQRVRARVRHPPGRRAEGAHDLRDHGRHHRRAAAATRSCSASTPVVTRCSKALEEMGFEIEGAGAEHRVQALQGDRRPQEAGHRDGSRGARHRRAAGGGLGLLARLVRGRGPLASARRTRACRGDAAGRRPRPPGRSPATARSTPSSRRSTRPPAIAARLSDFTIGAVTEGQDALGEVSWCSRSRARPARARASRRTSSTPRRGRTCGRCRSPSHAPTPARRSACPEAAGG